MHTRTQLACLYCSYGFMVLFGIGFIMAGFLPPPGPSESALQIAHHFQDHTTIVRLGIIICLGSSALLIPWGCGVAVQMRRIEGAVTPLTYIWIAATALVAIEFIYPCAFWGAAAFRPHDDQFVQHFDDLAWLPFIGVACTAILQAYTLGFLALRDDRPKPIYPRWFGYFNFWAGTLFAPASFVFLFKTGPFAWDGVISYWLLFTVGFGWFFVVTVMSARAVKAQALDPDPEPGTRDLDLVNRVAALERALSDANARTKETVS